jgi:tetratricopeptide (TPR) repeat protein
MRRTVVGVGLSVLLGVVGGPAAAAPPGAGAATVREYKKVIRTYPFADPSPLPVFGRIYPYFRFDRYTNQAVDREWTVVELENAYLRVMVLPEIGGKVWTAIEKSTGRAFIYDNTVVKFRDIAMRGPWTSGGLEPNYGIIGHTPNCATPVDYVTAVRADGAATVTVGTLDLLTRSAWRLEIALPAGKAYFTTRSLWQNTSGTEQPYYTWMNTGLKAAGGLEFVYPGTKYLGHGGEVSAWPIHPGNGKNLAFYDQNDFGSYKSYHVFGEQSDFWGAYYHDDEFGMARYSPRDDKLGKKIWIWGLSRQGMIWETLLTDTDGQYVEVQSGRLFNQAAEESTLTPFKHRGFAPYATDTWTEYWMPVKGTGGFVKANDLGALNVRVLPASIDLAFSPLEAIATTVEVFDGNTLVRSIPVTLAPMRTWKASVPAAVADRLRVRIAGDRFEYVADRSRASLSRPVEAPPAFDWTSVYGLWLKGKELVRQREYHDAEAAIDAALAKDPHYVPALADKALLRSRAGDDEAAIEAAARGLAVDTYDPQSNYYYGVSAMRLGRDADARDGFDVAAQDVGYRAASLLQLARLSLRSHQASAARAYAARSLEADHAGTEARLLLAVALRLAGRAPDARAVLDELLARDPLNHGARFESYRLQPSAALRQAFAGGIRSELRHETFLELAAWYGGLSMDDEARAVLALAPPVAEVLYWRAWLDRADPAKAKASLAAAGDASPMLVFPFRPESRPVFEWAMEHSCGAGLQPCAACGAGLQPCSPCAPGLQPCAWKPAYYLALLERGLGNEPRARSLVDSLGDAPDFAPFYVFRAQLASPGDWRVLADLQRAATLDPRDWRIGRLLVDRAIADGRVADAERTAAGYHAADPTNYMAGMAHARTLLLAAKYDEALRLLDGLQVLPYEGATEGRALHREAHLMLAVHALAATNTEDAERHLSAARDWPEHLGAGKPYAEDCDERLEDWLQAHAFLARGATGEARAAFERAVSSKAPRTVTGAIVAALALTALDRQGEVDAVLGGPEFAKDPAAVAWARGAAAARAGEADLQPPPSVAAATDFRVLRAWWMARPR